ncbi:GNAT family N-acetyltransferase [Hyphobacterium marinum]|uniref:GNAT family N-acetyltransferase n=1 Tax=Hyphobacterium marinum TaxID=3116574 RepID=A0ABU7LZ44_9PROT|nr:GNAT family N-acetyltransferase [Hyphobacterium sp. Y6023]MEE2566832.1 GNAT family N-acetyltransferase [Hyphobacterium sp. Y6023]
MTDITLRAISSLSGVDRAAWDAAANPPGEAFDPFLSWDFLEALEASGCASDDTGWSPRHIIAEDENGRLCGALPLYAKAHSYGEYVFDHAWADAYERAGGRYYPKLLSAVPFTPATGRRLLSPDTGVRRALAEAAISLTGQWGVSGWHVNFPGERDASDLDGLDLLARIDRQFVWFNDGYETYDDFLAALSSRKRKALKKERAQAQDGLEVVSLTGDALAPEHWDVFFACYQDTGSRKWGSPYLNREFFDLVHQRMADNILMVMAKQDGRFIAAALNFIGSEALYGRYWGSLVEKPLLHFELCYHRAIDFAIDHGLSRVEAGAQGEHKLARGYRPVEVRSAHYIADPGLRDALTEYLERERAAVRAEIAAVATEMPYRKS